MGSCSAFAAICDQGKKPFKGEIVSGVLGCMCSRHEMWRAQGMCNLPRGERYGFSVAP
jgi:hypothetical protein